MRSKLRTGILVAMVTLSVVAGVANPAAAESYDTFSSEDESMAYEIDWDPASGVANGDTVQIYFEDQDTLNGATANVTVRNADGGNTTYWASYSGIGLSPSDTFDVMVQVDDLSSGTVTEAQSVRYNGSETVQIADGEGVEANLTADSGYVDHPTNVTVSVISEDGTQTLESGTLSTNGDSPQYVDLNNLNVSGDSSNVTVQVAGATDDLGSTAYDPITGFSTTIISDGGGGGAGGGGGGGVDNQTLGIGLLVVAFVGLLWISRS